MNLWLTFTFLLPVGPFDTPHSDDGSSRWAAGMPHNALLDFAKPYISAFKNGAQAPVIDQDMLIYWYRPHMKDANCDSTDNCGSKPDGWDVSVLGGEEEKRTRKHLR